MIIQMCFMKEGYIRHLKLYPCERVNKRDVVKTGYTKKDGGGSPTFTLEVKRIK